MPNYDGFIHMDKNLLSEILTEHAWANGHMEEKESIKVEDIDFNEIEKSMVVHINIIRRTEH